MVHSESLVMFKSTDIFEESQEKPNVKQSLSMSERGPKKAAFSKKK